MKAFSFEEDEQDDRVDWPLCLLNKQMENYVGKSTGFGRNMLFALMTKALEQGQLNLEQTRIAEQKLAVFRFQALIADDWTLCSRKVKKETGFNEPNDRAGDSDSSEEEACVIC